MARDPYKYFRVEARELGDQLSQGLLELERSGSDGEIVPRLLRLAHTLKGAARVVRQPEIADHAHAIEEVLSPFRQLAGMIPREHVDSILHLIDAIAARVGELQGPTEPAEQAARAASPAKIPEEGFRVMRTDVAEIDGLLAGVTQASAQISALEDAATLAANVRHLTEEIADLVAAGGARPTGPSDAGRLGLVAASAERLRLLAVQLERRIVGTRQRTDRELGHVRDAVEQLRLVPAGALFASLERAARNSARELGKDVLFAGSGGGIRIDAHVVRVVHDAVLQLVRNAVAHGIEPPRDRVAAGKPRQGRVAVRVTRRGRDIVFRCEDDGRGIDVAALRGAALANGRPMADLDKLDAKGLVALLLQGGISTSAVVSEVAGRGIGMDIVRAAVTTLRGHLAVATEPGQGASFELVVPLSVSSVEALVLDAGGVATTVPLHAIRQTLRLAPHEIHGSPSGEAIVYDGHTIPLVHLARLLGRPTSPHRAAALSAVVVAATSGMAAVGVDRIIGTSSIVFRSLPELAPVSSLVAGASLNADGSALLMLDPEGLVAAAQSAGTAPSVPEAARRPLLVIDDSLTTRMLEQSILESAGYEVHVATSAEEGLERARGADYALILVDVEMPGMDGFAFIEQIRHDQRLRDTPAILVTSRNAPEDRQRGREVGAQGYVVKSEFDQAGLLEHISRLVA